MRFKTSLADKPCSCCPQIECVLDIVSERGVMLDIDDFSAARFNAWRLLGTRRCRLLWGWG